ncbi:hypothetical protein RvY_09688 [Ramazzottius varieornatus]|uniref:Uncharacterized protein n=1 Tax=Ramazzottius varieornatus TaxID=947166 RepID=A0A1D1VA84_RAMVA|nr:hypothetical protein RvY_09688 [Ramazzottius varieornatus]
MARGTTNLLEWKSCRLLNVAGLGQSLHLTEQVGLSFSHPFDFPARIKDLPEGGLVSGPSSVLVCAQHDVVASILCLTCPV